MNVMAGVGESRYETAIRTAAELLYADEREIPQGVLDTLQFVSSRGLWFLLSRNPPVRSCREAASNRLRLGRKGIPLGDELKSYLAEAQDGTGKKVLVLLHCGGDKQLALDAIRDLDIGVGDLRRWHPQPTDETELGYGLINPFRINTALGNGAKVYQVFDRSIVELHNATGTLMTNAGALDWAIEFRPTELIQSLDPGLVRIASIVGDPDRKQLDARTIGIITGNAPESGMLLWRKINGCYRRRLGKHFLGDVSLPRVVVHSIPEMGWSMELSARESPLWAVLKSEVDRMVREGVNLVALACHTTQYFRHRFDELLKPSGALFVSAADAVSAWAATVPEATTIAPLGIGHAIRVREPWSGYSELAECRNIAWPNDELINLTDSLAYEVKQTGVTPKTYQKLRRLVRLAPGEVVLLLLTELSMIVDVYPRRIASGKTVVDGLNLYADHITDTSLVGTQLAGLSPKQTP